MTLETLKKVERRKNPDRNPEKDKVWKDWRKAESEWGKQNWKEGLQIIFAIGGVLLFLSLFENEVNAALPLISILVVLFFVIAAFTR